MEYNPVPKVVPGLESGIRAISAETLHDCAITTTGKAMYWGNNDYGQLDRRVIGGMSLTPVEVVDSE